MSESIGSYLKRERELRRIPLSEISEHTRIKPEYLDAIEADQFDKIPGLIFAKGYLRAYAEYVGLNPEDVLVRFDELIGNSPMEIIPAQRPASLRWFWLITFLILIVTASVIVLWLRQ